MQDMLIHSFPPIGDEGAQWRNRNSGISFMNIRKRKVLMTADTVIARYSGRTPYPMLAKATLPRDLDVMAERLETPKADVMRAALALGLRTLDEHLRGSEFAERA